MSQIVFPGFKTRPASEADLAFLKQLLLRHSRTVQEDSVVMQLTRFALQAYLYVIDIHEIYDLDAKAQVKHDYIIVTPQEREQNPGLNWFIEVGLCAKVDEEQDPDRGGVYELYVQFPLAFAAISPEGRPVIALTFKAIRQLAELSEKLVIFILLHECLHHLLRHIDPEVWKILERIGTRYARLSDEWLRREWNRLTDAYIFRHLESILDRLGKQLLDRLGFISPQTDPTVFKAIAKMGNPNDPLAAFARYIAEQYEAWENSQQEHSDDSDTLSSEAITAIRNLKQRNGIRTFWSGPWFFTDIDPSQAFRYSSESSFQLNDAFKDYQHYAGTEPGEGRVQIRTQRRKGMDIEAWVHTRVAGFAQRDLCDPKVYVANGHLYDEELFNERHQPQVSLLVIVDTSASMMRQAGGSQTLLEKVLNPMLTAMADYGGYIIQVDAGVATEMQLEPHEVERFLEGLSTFVVHGLGGTDMCPAVARAMQLEEEGHQFDMVFFLTDGRWSKTLSDEQWSWLREHEVHMVYPPNHEKQQLTDDQQEWQVDSTGTITRINFMRGYRH